MTKNKDKNRYIKGGNLGHRLTVLSGVFVSMFLILILANAASAVLDCSMCHKTAPGSGAIKAIDTIEISGKTCLKCHNPDYPPKSIGYDTHLAHIGKYSASVDYLKRHPKAANSVNCDNCHMNIGENCRNCHIKNIPHMEPPLGNSCKGCHGKLDKLFQHSTINLQVHNIFNVNGTKACAMCHNPDNMASLKLASGDTVGMKDSYRLCFQCHSGYYNSWNLGQHYSNNSTIPSEKEIKLKNNMGTDVQEIRSGWESKWRQENTCVNCHNPHNPRELYQLPIASPEKNVGMSTTTMLLYVIVALIIIGAVVIGSIVKKRKLTLLDIKTILLGLRLSDLKRIKLPRLKLSDLKRIKLPKLKLPKIPISLSVEKLDEEDRKENVDEVGKTGHIGKVDKIEKAEQVNSDKHIKQITVVEKAETVEKAERISGDKPVDSPDTHNVVVEKLPDEIVPKIAKKKFLQKYRYDIAFLLIICVVLSSFYVIFGAFMPLAIVVSESMSPHIERGDVVFYTTIDKVEQISTYNKKNSVSFEDYGDVVLYKPLGEEGATPYVHRVMYYVNKGDDMWPGGKKAPHAGYITKGDNMGTNRQFDQQGSVSKDTPIKRDWIVGVAKFRIPYIGYIRLALS